MAEGRALPLARPKDDRDHDRFAALMPPHSATNLDLEAVVRVDEIRADEQEDDVRARERCVDTRIERLPRRDPAIVPWLDQSLSSERCEMRPELLAEGLILVGVREDKLCHAGSSLTKTLVGLSCRRCCVIVVAMPERARPTRGSSKTAPPASKHELGSLQQAVARSGMSYRSVWGYLRELERAAGFAFLDRRRGARPQGGTRLTPAARRFLANYRRFRPRVDTAVAREFRRRFCD